MRVPIYSFTQKFSWTYSLIPRPCTFVMNTLLDVFYVLDMPVLNTTTILRAIKKKEIPHSQASSREPVNEACIYITRKISGYCKPLWATSATPCPPPMFTSYICLRSKFQWHLSTEYVYCSPLYMNITLVAVYTVAWIPQEACSTKVLYHNSMYFKKLMEGGAQCM